MLRASVVSAAVDVAAFSVTGVFTKRSAVFVFSVLLVCLEDNRFPIRLRSEAFLMLGVLMGGYGNGGIGAIVAVIMAIIMAIFEALFGLLGLAK